MFEYDICLCGNKENCPKKETCERAVNPGPGIYTLSLFYQENKECEYYLSLKQNKNGE